MKITRTNMPTSLTVSVIKYHVYKIIDANRLFSNKEISSKVYKISEIIYQMAKCVFLTLMALPIDCAYIPIGNLIKYSWQSSLTKQDKDKFFSIDVVGKWSGDASDVPINQCYELMEKPEKFVSEKIDIPIALFEKALENPLELKEENLTRIFDIINKYTLNIPYPCFKLSSRYFGSIFNMVYVHRPNHNGTHSARQVRYLEALFQLFENKSDAVKEVFQNNISLTSEEKLNLK